MSENYYTFLRYDKGEDENLKVIPKEAMVVEYVYSLFLLGVNISLKGIYLMSNKILTSQRKSSWNLGSVRNMFSNEKYKGDALLQKSI